MDSAPMPLILAQAAPDAIMQLAPLAMILGVFYFLLIRPQQKKQKETRSMLANLKRGDKVKTAGGLHGTITGITDTVVTLEIAEKVRVKVDRNFISAVTAREGTE